MTSNGETGARIYPYLANAGLVGVNVSIFGSTPEEYIQTQPECFGVGWARNKLLQSTLAIEGARSAGIEVRANCVMSSSADEERITRLIDRSKNEGFLLRILNNLYEGEKSIIAIYNMLAGLGALPEKRKITAGSSTCSVYYRLPSGIQISFKQIRRERFEDFCRDCFIDKAGDCEEGYYGMRLYRDAERDVFKIGFCIQRMNDFTFDTDGFFSSELPRKIKNFRESEYEMIRKEYLKNEDGGKFLCS